MAAKSYTSSMEAQNGSYSNSTYQADSVSQHGNSYASAASTARARYPRGQSQPNQNTPFQEPTHSSQGDTGSYDDSAVHAQSSLSYCNESQNYYLQSALDSYPSYAAAYESEITLEEESNGTSNGTSYSTSAQTEQSSGNSQQLGQYAAQQPQYATHGANLYSERIRAWSEEDFLDEKLRLGIPTLSDRPQRQQYQYVEGSSTYGPTTSSRS